MGENKRDMFKTLVHFLFFSIFLYNLYFIETQIYPEYFATTEDEGIEGMHLVGSAWFYTNWGLYAHISAHFMYILGLKNQGNFLSSSVAYARGLTVPMSYWFLFMMNKDSVTSESYKRFHSGVNTPVILYLCSQVFF